MNIEYIMLWDGLCLGKCMMQWIYDQIRVQPSRILQWIANTKDSRGWNVVTSFPCCWHVVILFDRSGMHCSPCSAHPEIICVGPSHQFFYTHFFTVELGGTHFSVSSNACLKWNTTCLQGNIHICLRGLIIAFSHAHYSHFLNTYRKAMILGK